MNSKPLVTIIIPTLKAGSMLDRCLKSIVNSKYPKTEVIVINNSTQKSIIATLTRKYRSRSWIRFFTPSKNLYFAQSVDYGLKKAQGKYTLIFNDDATLEAQTLDRLVKKIESSPSIGAVHPKVILGHSNQVDTVGGAIDPLGFAYKQHQSNPQKLFYVGIGLYRTSLLNKLGGYDPDFIIYWEDVDLSWRIHLSHHYIVLEPQAIIRHFTSSTTRSLSSPFNTYHVRKNRLCGLIKNYSLSYLLVFLPLLLTSYLILCLTDSFLAQNLNPVRVTLKAIIWNIYHLPPILNKRRFIQTRIRKVNDTYIFNLFSLPKLFR